MDFLETLGIDYRLLIAQIINFGILLFLLTRFAYRPIMGALDARKERIAKSLADASKAEERSKSLAAEHEQMLQKTGAEVNQMLAEARERAEAIRQQIVSQASGEAEEIIAKAKHEADRLHDQTITEARAHLAGLVVDATERVIRTKLSSKDDKALVEEALKEVAS